ncbi:unnamed protein product [Rotaria magnacalcarata]|nr:unnamed protein product [Rotaria magnacalcarata]CAF2115512.1 unnamed protein product [Rotaria magnacalcarata]
MEVATWYLKAIDLEGKLQPMNYLNLFKMHLKVAECLENDKIYYDKAKNIVTNLTEENGPLQTARLYFKLAQHCSLYSDRDHGEALNCYLACLHTQQEALPENDLNIALTYKQIATLHNDHLSSHEIREPSFSEYLAYTSIAEFFMGKCLPIQLKTLPATHPELAKTYFWFRSFYLSAFQRNIALALEYFEKAINIFQTITLGSRWHSRAIRHVHDIKSGFYMASQNYRTPYEN